MGQNFVLHLTAANTQRQHLVGEQIVACKDYRLGSTNEADLIIVEAGNNTHGTSADKIVYSLPSGPLRLGEVMDKIRYLLSGRTQHIEKVEDIRLGHFVFHPHDNTLMHVPTGHKITLTDKERLLLRVLYQAENHTMTRANLLKTVWQYADDTETHTFETHLYRLRQKLEPYEAHHMIKADGDGNYTLITT